MPQYGRPSSDIIATSFIGANSSGAVATNLYTTLDENSADNTDYITSNLSPSYNVYVCKLSSMTDPLTNTGHVVTFTYARSVDTNAEQIDLEVQLRKNYVSEVSLGTHVANTIITDIPYTWTTNTITLTTAEAETLSGTDYENLYLRFIFNKPA